MMSFIRLLIAFALAMLLLPDWPADAATTSAATPDTSSHTAWLVGLICGVIITIAARIRWRDLPSRMAHWVRDQSTRAGWAAMAMCYTWILLFY